jgi:nanoRNase/pAp phosphatase (c-di-AMP/oligoRNAs hydrolase)
LRTGPGSLGSQELYEELIKLAKGSDVKVLMHGNADLDAVASAFLVCRLLEGVSRSCCLYSPQGLSKQSRDLLASLSLNIPLCDSLDDQAGVLITVDASNVSQLGVKTDALRGAKLVVIDHHSPGSLHTMATLLISDESAPSCVEVVLSLAAPGSLKLKPAETTLLLTAILEETSLLERASISTFRHIVKLMEMGADYAFAVGFLRQSNDEPIDKRAARLKGLSRAAVSVVCGQLAVAVTHVGSFEAEVARSMISLGADVVAAINGERASLRVSRRALKFNIRASELAAFIAERLGGEGGGHDGAAALRLKSPNQATIDKVLGLAVNFVRQRCGDSSG